MFRAGMGWDPNPELGFELCRITQRMSWEFVLWCCASKGRVDQIFRCKDPLFVCILCLL